MGSMSLVRVGGVCAILAALSFIVATVIHNVGDLPGYRWLPDDPGQWLLDMNRDRTSVVTEAWLKIVGVVLSMAFALGLYQALRQAGPLLLIAVVAAITTSLLIIAQLLIVLGVAQELAPAYAEASVAIRPTLEVMVTTLLQIGVLAEFMADHLIGPVRTALFGLAIILTSVLPRWLGWVGLVLAFVRWLGLLEPVSDVFRVFSIIGFIGGGVWILAIAVAMLRLREPVADTAEA